MNKTGTNLEGAQQALIDTHHSTSVVELSAVIGRAEQRDQLTLRKEFVAVLHNLMGPTDQIHVVFLQEPRNNVGAEGERDTTIVLAPARDVLIRIGP